MPQLPFPAALNGESQSKLRVVPSTLVIPLTARASESEHVPARTYRALSPAWELAKDPAPRLGLFLVGQQALLV